MKNFSEFFEFLSHCNHQTIIDELKEHGMENTHILTPSVRFKLTP